MRSLWYLHVCVTHPNNARQQLDKHIPMATDTHGTIKELFDTVFSMLFFTRKLDN
jgi:hypothetical protein